MSRRARRILLSAAAAVLVFYVVILFAWAARPLTDAVPVGTDFTQKAFPGGVLVSKEVSCDNLFGSSDAPRSGLPTLTLQTKDHAQLAFQRGVCTAVRRDARVIFGLDTLATIAVLGGIAYVFKRQAGVTIAPVAHATAGT